MNKGDLTRKTFPHLTDAFQIIKKHVPPNETLNKIRTQIVWEYSKPLALHSKPFVKLYKHAQKNPKNY